MFSVEQRQKAIETLIACGLNYTDTKVMLGYPSFATLHTWWKHYRATGNIPLPKRQQKLFEQQVKDITRQKRQSKAVLRAI